MFGMNDQKKNKNGRGIIIPFFASIALLAVILLVTVFTIPSGMKSYQKKRIDTIESAVDKAFETTDEQELVNNIKDVTDKYVGLEILILFEEEPVYSSNTVETTSKQNAIYNDFVYRKIEEKGEYILWMCITKIDTLPYITSRLTLVAFIVIAITISQLVLINILHKRVTSPLSRVLMIVNRLRGRGDKTYSVELESISNEILHLFNSISLKSANYQFLVKEYQKTSEAQQKLLHEQKEFLQSTVHALKTPLSSINMSRYLITRDPEYKALNDKSKELLNSIQNQCETTNETIVSALNAVIADSIDVFEKRSKIDFKDEILNYFNVNQNLMDAKYLDYKIDGEKSLLANKIKILQIVDTIIGNMVIYSKENTTLEIQLNEDTMIFKNQKSNQANPNSTKYGLVRTHELCEELNAKVEVEESASEYKLIIKL